jgi:hypothetical protein
LEDSKTSDIGAFYTLQGASGTPPGGSYLCLLNFSKEVKTMAIKVRSFAEILAGMQGGIRLKPGQAVSRKMHKSLVREIFGEEIAAYSSPSLTITVRHISGDDCMVTVRRGDTIT